MKINTDKALSPWRPYILPNDFGWSRETLSSCGKICFSKNVNYEQWFITLVGFMNLFFWPNLFSNNVIRDDISPEENMLTIDNYLKLSGYMFLTEQEYEKYKILI